MAFLFSGLIIVAIAPHLCGEIRLLAVTTSFGFRPGLPGPGSPATIFCTGLNIAGAFVATGSPLPGSIAGISVTYGSVRAPIYGVADLGAFQIVNFQVPWEDYPTAPALSHGDNSLSPPTSLAPWGEFATDSAGYAIAFHAADWTLVTASNPTRPGEWIALYGSNFGAVSNPPVTGSAAPIDHLVSLDGGGSFPWSFKMLLQDPAGDRDLATNFMGLAPALIGVYQINVQMPDGLPTGGVQIYVQRSRDCGFFFTQGCGRGLMLNISAIARLPR